MNLIFFIVLCAIAQKEKENDGENNTIIVIDLGITYSCCGVYMNGSVKIIPNEQGNTKTPSVVAFTDDDILVGEAAKNQAAINPSRTLYLLTFRYADQIVYYDKYTCLMISLIMLLSHIKDSPLKISQWIRFQRSFNQNLIQSFRCKSIQRGSLTHVYCS